jgi:acetyl esterase/lipase
MSPRDSEQILTEPAPPPSRAIRYGPEPTNFGHLRLPSETAGAGAALVVLFHGGFWRKRYDLQHLGHLAAALTAEGVATWSIEYRRVGDGGGWPITCQDAAHGVAFVEQLAAAYGLDLSRVVLIGHSAGGHLALWVAAAERALGIRAWDPALWRPRALIGLAPVADLRLAMSLGLGSGAVDEFLGSENADAEVAFASPAELVPLGLPQVLVHGERDQNVPLEVTRAYAERARAAGDSVDVVSVAECGHFELIDPRSAAWPVVRDAVLGGLSSAWQRPGGQTS